LARALLLEKLDLHYNPGETKTDLRVARTIERKRQRAKKSRKKQREPATLSSNVEDDVHAHDTEDALNCEDSIGGSEARESDPHPKSPEEPS